MTHNRLEAVMAMFHARIAMAEEAESKEVAERQLAEANTHAKALITHVNDMLLTTQLSVNTKPPA